MSNGKQEDIGVRIVTDYQQALKDTQAFTGAAGKELSGLPKIVQQIGTSVDALAAQIGKLSHTNGPRDLQQDLTALPPVVERLAKAANQAADNLEKIGQKGRRGLREANDDASRLSRTLDKLVTGGKAVGAAFAGIQAGKMVFAPHLERMVDYDTKLAHLANVALADKTVAERISGKAQLNKEILNATRAGGGTRDEAADALQKIMGSGAVSDKDALTMLPSVMKGATASGARPEEIADIGIRAMQNFGFKASDMPKIMDMALKSGNLGGFELKDMAKWLPQQMAEGANLGMKGEKGLAQLLALNQASITTAGSTDMAGNNVANLLAKINSNDTKLDFKKQGIDLTGSLQNAIGKGMDPITAFSKLVDQVMRKDKRYVALESKLKGASGKEQETILEQQLALVQGSAIGNVLQDRQAKGAFLGFRKQSAEFDKQIQATTNGAADGTTSGNYAVVGAGPGFKQQQSQNELLNAQNEAMQKLVPTLNLFWDGISKVGREYPVLSTAIGGSQIAITTLGAGAGAASIVMALLTKNAAAASATLGGVAATGSGKNLSGGGYGSGMGRFGKGLNLLSAGATGYEVGTLLNDHVIDPLANKVGGGKGDTLGSLLYDWTHKDPMSQLNGPLPSKPQTFGENVAMRKEGVGLESNGDAVQRALAEGLKPLPIDARLKIDVAFNEMGKPYVVNQTMSGNGLRLDTGPMLTH